VLECDGIASHSAHNQDGAPRVNEILKIIFYEVRKPKMIFDSISATGFESVNSH
jgi:hypothetical protein